MSVSLDLLHSRLYGQDVAVDAVCGRTFAIRCSRGSFHFVVVGPPSSTFSPPVRDNQHVSGILKSSARKRGLHPSKIEIERMRIANQLAERTAEVCSIVRSWDRRFPVLHPRACMGSPSLFRMAPTVGWHVRARRTDSRLASAGARSLVPILEGRPLGFASAVRRFRVGPPGRELCLYNVMFRQSSFFGTATFTRAIDLADLPPACQQADKEHQHRDRLDLTCPCPLSRGTTSLAHVSRLCSMGLSTTFPRLALCLTILVLSKWPAALAVSLGPLAPVLQPSGKVTLATARGPR